MIIGNRLRVLREGKNLSQGDIEKRTGLLRCYISRVENGYTVPSLENLEKFARALEVPLYRLFYESVEAPKVLVFPSNNHEENTWGNSGEAAHYFNALRALLARIDERNRNLVLHIARKMTRS